MADHRAIARRALDAFTTGDFSGLEDAYAPGHVLHDTQNPFLAEHAGGLDVLRAQVDMFRAAFPDEVMTVVDQYEDGDVVVSRWSSTGTHTGDLPILPATGRTATTTGILIDRFEGGQIVESWSSWDTLGMLQQLGAVPAPA